MLQYWFHEPFNPGHITVLLVGLEGRNMGLGSVHVSPSDLSMESIEEGCYELGCEGRMLSVCAQDVDDLPHHMIETNRLQTDKEIVAKVDELIARYMDRNYTPPK